MNAQPTSVRKSCSELAGNRLANHATVFRHNGWLRLRKMVIEALVATKQTGARVESFLCCGEGSYVLKSDDSPPRYRIAGSHCHDRFCVPCANERSTTIAHNVIDYVQHKTVRFVTLTLKHQNRSLADSLDHLYSSWKRLRKNRNWKRRVTGGIAFIEVKHSDVTGCWHPHIHALIGGRYLAQALLSHAWQDATGGSTIVDIRKVDGTAHVARYVTKYASKPLNHTFQHTHYLLAEAIEALKGRRLCMAFGAWRKIKLTDSLPEDGWTQIATLDELIHRASEGDLSAIGILTNLDAQAASVAIGSVEPRPPPVVIPTPSPSEPMLFATACDSVF